MLTGFYAAYDFLSSYLRVFRALSSFFLTTSGEPPLPYAHHGFMVALFFGCVNGMLPLVINAIPNWQHEITACVLITLSLAITILIVNLCRSLRHSVRCLLTHDLLCLVLF